MNRRQMLRRTGLAALLLGTTPLTRSWLHAADAAKKRILMFTRSQGYEHDVVKRKGGGLSLAEQIVTDLGPKHGYEVVCEKDGRVFLSNDFAKFDGFLFETQGDLGAETSKDNTPPVPPEGKKALLDAVAAGKGFVGCHCAGDTYHSPGGKWEGQDRNKLDPYIAMLGGEFIVHGDQQEAGMHVADTKFPGLKGVEDFKLNEEWYALKNFAPDLHVILVQETKGMKTDGRNAMYLRPDFPATWARKHEKGRVFYTSMGHRDDVWKNETFQKLLMGGLAWALGNMDADIPPNLDKAAPKANELPKEPKK
jgi:type 1 glutamine amidotransferase